MANQKPILVADDLAQEGGPKKRSLAIRQCASKLAQKLQTSVELVYVENIHSFYPKGQSPFKRLIDAYLKEQKAKLIRASKTLKVSTRATLIEADPVKGILNLIGKKEKFELVVIGTHGRTGWDRLLVGSVAEEIIRQSPIPVMTIGPNGQKTSSQFLKDQKPKILIATHLTLNSWRAEVFGIDLARRLKAEVIFFHNMQEALHPILKVAFAKPHSTPAVREYFEETKDLLRKQLAKKVEKAKKCNVDATAVLDDQSPSAGESILKQAIESESSLIIMGTHGRSLASGLFFGRTAREVILNSSIPVITAHSKKH